MQNKRKIISLVAAAALMLCLGTSTAFAEPGDESAAGGDSTYVSDSTPDTPVYSEPDYSQPDYSEPVYSEPVYSEPDSTVSNYDNNNNGDNGNSYTDGGASTVYEENNSAIVGSAENFGNSVTSYDQDGNEYREPPTDYEEPTSDPGLYSVSGNGNGSTLSADEWKLALDTEKLSADGSGDFSFIKNNDASGDSNTSFLFLIAGILLILISITILTVMIVFYRKKKKAEAFGGGSYRPINRNGNKPTGGRSGNRPTGGTSNVRMRTNFQKGKTAEIDIDALRRAKNPNDRNSNR